MWTGTLEATGDGEYVTAPVTLTQPGYYTYREWIAESDLVAAVETACAEVVGDDDRPRPTGDHDADQRAGDGAGRPDHGLGGRQRPRQAGRDGQRRALGPVPDARGDPLRGHAVLDRHASGERRRHVHDGARHARAGRLLHVPRVDRRHRGARGRLTACGEVSETTIAKAAPKVTTVARTRWSSPDDEIFDQLTVTGPRQDAGDGRGRALRPVRVARGHRLRGRAVLEGQGGGHRRRDYNSPKATVRRAGFYVFRERIAATESVAALQGECAIEAETSLAAPLILGGRGDAVAYVAGRRRRARRSASGSRGSASTRRFGGRDRHSSAGALGIPTDIRRVGWWRDGAAPGDDARHGPARRPRRQRARTARARSTRSSPPAAATVIRLDDRRYRVTSVRRMRKRALPSSIYSRTGPARLVLVTCGGPFDGRRYRDNVIVTASAA